MASISRKPNGRYAVRWLEGGKYRQTTVDTEDEAQELVTTYSDPPLEGEPVRATLTKLAQLLDDSGIDIEDIGRVERVNVHQGFYKDANNEAQLVDMASITLSPKWAEGPKWPVIEQGPRVHASPSMVRVERVEGWQKAIVLPDMQVGFFRTRTGLEPIHDEAALAVARAIVAEEQPDKIVMVGDNADLAEFGKYRLTPAFQETTQATVDRLTILIAELRAAAPDAEIVWLEGNHEARLPNYLLDNARAAFGLRRGQSFDEAPVLSIPYLCRFEDHGITYLPGYPATTYWINDRLQVIHGRLVVSNGSTAHKYLQQEKTSIIYGHIHRREYAAITRTDRYGSKEVMAASPGCLARIDGVVPSTKGGVDLDGRPIRSFENWQQGLAVVDYEPGDGRFSYQNIAIHNGWAFHNSKEFAA